MYYMHGFLFHFLESHITHEHKMCALLSPIELFQTLCTVTKYLASYVQVMVGTCAEIDVCFH